MNASRHDVLRTWALATLLPLAAVLPWLLMSLLPAHLVDESAYVTRRGEPDLAAVQNAYNAVRQPIGVASAALLAALAAGAGVLINRRTVAIARDALDQTRLADDSRRSQWRQEHLFTRFNEASKQLGDVSPHVRLAGVYAMASLADDWPDRRRQCVDVLCAYLRLPYATDPTDKAFRAGDREVRRTILRQIRDHMRPGQVHRWDGCLFLFEGAVFDCGDLSKAEFGEGCRVSFHGAQFVEGTVDLTGVKLKKGSRMYFTEAVLEGGVVKLDEAVIEAEAELSFRDVTIRGGAVTHDDVQAHATYDIDWPTQQLSGRD